MGLHFPAILITFSVMRVELSRFLLLVDLVPNLLGISFAAFILIGRCCESVYLLCPLFRKYVGFVV